MLYLAGAKFEKKSCNIRNCGRWSDILSAMFPEISLFTSGLDILRNILSMRVLLFLQTLVDKRFCRGLLSYITLKIDIYV